MDQGGGTTWYYVYYLGELSQEIKARYKRTQLVIRMMRKVMEFHQIAKIFPMLGEEELGKLADDIRQNGLHQPIMLVDKNSILETQPGNKTSKTKPAKQRA